MEYEQYDVFEASVSPLFLSPLLASKKRGCHHVLYSLAHTEAREGTPAYTLIATQTPPPDPAARDLTPDFTAIVLNLIRLEKESTDILITINVPHIKCEYSEEEVDLQVGKQGKLISDAVDYAARIWETFKIKDWGLFNEV
jgi:hypothetical protein